MPYEYGNQQFVNPYQFVSLEDHCKRGHHYRNEKQRDGLRSGWLECELETLTPVFIPNTTNNDTFRRRAQNDQINSYDFYSYTNLEGVANPQPAEPVIPGSELRGMIRSAFETVTASCMSAVDEKNKLYKRVSYPASPGLIYKNAENWFLQPCERYGINARCHNNKDPRPPFNLSTFQEGEKVYIAFKGNYYYRGSFNHKTNLFKLVDAIQKTQSASCNIEGYFHKGESFPRKHHESVFVVKNGTKPVPLTANAVKNYIKNLELYADSTVNIDLTRSHQGYRHIIRDLSNPKKIPVYYSIRNGKYYLSPAAIGREVFHNMLPDLLGEFASCADIENFCAACAMFGMVTEKKEDGVDVAVSSRIRFTDTTVKTSRSNKADYYDSIVTLPELASPKLSCTEFYLKKPQNNSSDIF